MTNNDLQYITQKTEKRSTSTNPTKKQIIMLSFAKQISQLCIIYSPILIVFNQFVKFL